MAVAVVIAIVVVVELVAEEVSEVQARWSTSRRAGRERLDGEGLDRELLS